MLVAAATKARVGQLFQQALVIGGLERQVGHSGLGGEVALPAGSHIDAQ